MAFHPEFSTNRYVYIFFTASRHAYSVSEDNAGNLWQVHMWGGFNRLIASESPAGIAYFAEVPGSHSSLAALPDASDNAQPVVERARAYLHANCANCHQPNGPGRGGLDFRY